ncbi:signal peptidase, endoplasmic reticulum-type [Sporobacter termitidis DSM 10068]|uniref:Signal peptidase I n=1 Tax=Sporobacter termitidis DSM 10068 TaxID=1123282 RepID=A0A1M5Y4I5_9FIRM|nr:signal peptidase I [Sporobacter termitidis]SHI06886.1 signal peptidase, endoplasmic reticulum-type [Sporobacter termitidis DSM 10068]
MKKSKKGVSALRRILTAVGYAVCAVLAVIVVVNVTLIVKSYVHPDTVPDFLGYKPFIVLSGSMEPAITAGDLIITREIAPENVSVGDIISFRTDEDAVVSHRVTEINTDGGLSFQTKGDANVGTDNGSVSPDKIEGLYIWRAANLGRLALFIQTPLGMLVFVITPICLFILYDVIARARRNRKKPGGETELAALNTAGKGDDET